MGKIKEKLLFSRLKSKDEEAFIKTYDLYVDHIYRFVYFKIGDVEEAQDLTSAIFLKAWNYIQTNSLTDYKTLKALIYKIARSSVIDHYRSAARRNDVAINNETEEDGFADIVDKSQDIAKKVELTFDLAVIEKKLSDLKDEYREIIVLRFIEDFSIGEIAEILDKTKGNVRVLVYRALKALKDLVEE